jgi:hypothetical protein
MQQFCLFLQFYLLEKHFTNLPPNTTCFGLAGHLQVCLQGFLLLLQCSGPHYPTMENVNQCNRMLKFNIVNSNLPCIPSNLIYFKCILIIFSYLRLCLSSGLLTSGGFPTQILQIFPVSPYMLHPVSFILLHVIALV